MNKNFAIRFFFLFAFSSIYGCSAQHMTSYSGYGKGGHYMYMTSVGFGKGTCQQRSTPCGALKQGGAGTFAGLTFYAMSPLFVVGETVLLPFHATGHLFSPYRRQQAKLERWSKKQKKKYRKGMSELTLAAMLGQTEKIKTALDKGAKINERDKHGNTALNEAVYEGRKDAVNLLLEKGADPNIQGTDNSVVRQATILGRGASSSALVQAVMLRHHEIEKLLLDKGADPNAKDSSGETALMKARDMNLAKILLEKGADVNATDEKGNTALMLAAGQNLLGSNIGIVTMLLSAGADWQMANKEGKTALMMAADPEIVALLKGTQKKAQRAAELKAQMDRVVSIEIAGDQAGQDGKLDEALTHYISALKETPAGSEPEQRLRKKIIHLALSLDPPLDVPEEAKRRMVRSQAFIERADFNSAASELKEAAKVAPWWPTAYFNLGIAQEKAEDFAGAIKSFKLYLLSAPNAEDADKVQKRIYKLEVSKEQAGQKGDE